MTTYARSTLKTFFENGDVPSGTDYSNLIDSCLNIVETGVQTMGGALNPTELITSRVSAGTGIFTGDVNVAGIISANNISMFGILSANSINMYGNLTNTGNILGSAATFTGDVSASTSTIYASAMRSTNGVFSGVGVVSAAGTAQATAAVLTNVINRGKGVADGVTTGFTPLANRAGLVQYLYNEGPSANLWPPTGGTINGLAANTAFSLATSAMVTIVHITASAYAVK